MNFNDSLIEARLEIERPISIMSVAISPEESAEIRQGGIFRRAEIINEPGWEAARTRLLSLPPDIVISEQDLPDGTWRDVLAVLLQLTDPPPLIVASRLADAYLWGEVLNLGGYDLIAKPFDPQEVERTIIGALRQRTAEHKPADYLQTIQMNRQEDPCSTVLTSR